MSKTDCGDGPSEPFTESDDEELYPTGNGGAGGSPNPNAKRSRRLVVADLSSLSDLQDDSSEDDFERSSLSSMSGLPVEGHNESFVGSPPTSDEAIEYRIYSPSDLPFDGMDDYDGSTSVRSAANSPTEVSGFGFGSPPTSDNAGAAGASESREAENVEAKVQNIPPGVNVLNAHHERQLGYSARVPPSYFCNSVMGNLNYVKRLELMHKLKGHDGCVNSLSFNKSGTRLASGSDDCNVIVWDWPTAQQLVKFDTGHRLNVFQSKFVPCTNDLQIVTCARDGHVRLAELSSDGSCLATRLLARHAGTCHKLACDPDSPNLVLSCGEDGQVFEIDLRSATKSILVRVGQRRNAGRFRSIPLYSIHLHPRNSNLFAVGGEDICCYLFDRRRISDGNSVAAYCPQSLATAGLSTAITCAVFNHSGSELLATYQDSEIHLFDATNQNHTDSIKSFKGHRNNATVKGVNFYGPYSEFVVSGSDCGHIYFWEKQSQQIVKFMPGDTGGVVNVLEPNPVCSVLATSGLDSDIKIWVPSSDTMEMDRQLLKQLTDSNTDSNISDLLDSTAGGFHDMNIVYSRLRAIWGRGLHESDGSDSDEVISELSSDDNTESQVAINCRPS